MILKVKINWNAPYSQDFHIHRCSKKLSLIEFTATKQPNGRYKLVAVGYGDLKGKNTYGNGAISISEQYLKFQSGGNW